MAVSREIGVLAYAVRQKEGQAAKHLAPKGPTSKTTLTVHLTSLLAAQEPVDFINEYDLLQGIQSDATDR